MKKTPLKRRRPLRKRKPANNPGPKTEVEILDDLVRRIVMLRDHFKCQWCEREIVGEKGRKNLVLQAAHLLPKGAYPALRHELTNVVVLCWHCHFCKWHKSPIEAWDWVRQKWGDGFIERLRFLARTRKKVDKAALKIYLEAELERLSGATQRATPENGPKFSEGVTGSE